MRRYLAWVFVVAAVIAVHYPSHEFAACIVSPTSMRAPQKCCIASSQPRPRYPHAVRTPSYVSMVIGPSIYVQGGVDFNVGTRFNSGYASFFCASLTVLGLSTSY
jgi:hypothetical protein